MSSDNQFTALGPTEIGFQTNDTNTRMGASITGGEVGVRGDCDNEFAIEGTGGSGGVHEKGTSKQTSRRVKRKLVRVRKILRRKATGSRLSSRAMTSMTAGAESAMTTRGGTIHV